jgi:Circularly permutated YpsA SLOG family
LLKIVSGGQTGVDRAALDAALELGLLCGGWCPQGRRAEDGPLHARYPLTETPADEYAQRTEWNVRDSDGTLILHRGSPEGGTALTIELAKRMQKPCLEVNLNDRPRIKPVRSWLKANRVGILNVAGPRESQNSGIYQQAVKFLRKVLK